MIVIIWLSCEEHRHKLNRLDYTFSTTYEALQAHLFCLQMGGLPMLILVIVNVFFKNNSLLDGGGGNHVYCLWMLMLVTHLKTIDICV